MIAHVPGNSEYPYSFVRDSIQLEYDDVKRVYRVEFTKTIRNTGTSPLTHFYARINVCAFPNHRELSRLVYRSKPLTVEFMQFDTYMASGRSLAWEVVEESDSNIEFNIVFKDRHTKELFAVSPDESIEVSYSLILPDTHWGPYLERHCRVPCEEIVVVFLMPHLLCRIECELKHPNSLHHGTIIRPSTQTSSEKKPGDVLKWVIRSPLLHARYRFNWSFADNRYEELVSQLFYSLEGTVPHLAVSLGFVRHSEDFRTVTWFGKTFSLTAMQAAIVRLIWASWENRVGEVSQDYLLTEAGSNAKRVLDVFRRTPAWGGLIESGEKKGTIRLKKVDYQRFRIM